MQAAAAEKEEGLDCAARFGGFVCNRAQYHTCFSRVAVRNTGDRADCPGFNVYNYTVDEGNCRAEIDIAQITGLSNKELENTINQELRTDGEALVHQFEEDVAELRELDGDAHMGFETDFDVMASNENVFSLRVMYHSMSGSSNTWYKFYNVNQKTGELITLDSLFLKGSDYLGTINTYLIGEMKSNTEADGKSIYAVNPEDEAYGWAFTGIESDHNFYINGRGHLVIAFDKYEVAAGYVGTPEFEIPTDIISDLLRPDAPVLK